MLFFLHILAFFVGSIPIGFLIARLKGIDIRSTGSGNVGATNVGRSLGKRAGIITLIGDALKGVIGVFLAVLMPEQAQLIAPTLGLAAILGHCFSPFLAFKGGKGVATSLGVFLALAPAQTGVAVVLFLLTVFTSGYVSLGSMVAAVSMPIIASFYGIGEGNKMLILATSITAILIIFRHRTNIQRIAAGEESKLRKQGS